MANKPFDRMIVNPKERHLSPDINTLQTQLDLATRTAVWQMFNRRTTAAGITYETAVQQLVAALDAGFHGNSFRVNATAPASMAVTVEAGLGWYNDNTTATSIGGILGLDDPSNFKPLWNQARATIAVPAADPGLPRIDIVEVIATRAAGDITGRQILDTATGIFSAPAPVNKTLSYGMSTSVNGAAGINYKTGVPNAVPVAPALSAGYVKIAEVRVAAASATVPQVKVADFRPLIFPGNRGAIHAHLLCTGAAPGVMQSVQGSPGLNVTANHLGNPPANVTDWVISGGDMSRTMLTMNASALAVAAVASFAWINQAGPADSVPIIRTVSAAEAAALNSAAWTAPSPIGEGQKVWWMESYASALLTNHYIAATFNVSRVL